MNVYTEAHLRPETWMVDAMCAQTDADAWFPDHGDKPTAERAKTICREACPVREQCLEYALRTEQQVGIWAGYSAKSLLRLRKKRRAA